MCSYLWKGRLSFIHSSALKALSLACAILPDLRFLVFLTAVDVFARNLHPGHQPIVNSDTGHKAQFSATGCCTACPKFKFHCKAVLESQVKWHMIRLR